MKSESYIKRIGVGALLMLICACIEPLELESYTYEDALVVESIITGEVEYQEVQLRRTFSLEETGPVQERNAAVVVRSEDRVYEFRETEPGRYISVEPFQAVSGRSYTIEITTTDGRAYSSESEELPSSAEIRDLYAERVTYEGEDGVAILLDMQGPEQSSGFYKYDFTETYKIMSPYFHRNNMIYRNGELIQVPKTKEERVCYVTEESSDILMANTNLQSGNAMDRFLVKFMHAEDHRTAYRYSISVRQYSLTSEAFSFYETLEDFSNSENLFSQNQLGLIKGNISSQTDPDEKVIGYFAVAGVSSERIFFDLEDIYEPYEISPASHVECEIIRPDMSPSALPDLGERLANGTLKYIGFSAPSIHKFARAECVDCTFFGDNVAPDFWEE